MLEDENQELLYRAGNGEDRKTGARNTCNKYVAESEYVQSSELLKSLMEVSLTAEVFPTIPEAVVIWNFSQNVLNSIFFKDAPVKDKLSEFAQAVKNDIETMMN